MVHCCCLGTYLALSEKGFYAVYRQAIRQPLALPKYVKLLGNALKRS